MFLFPLTFASLLLVWLSSVMLMDTYRTSRESHNFIKFKNVTYVINTAFGGIALIIALFFVRYTASGGDFWF